jgi:sugar lactone lactonase YvrE
MVHRPTERHRPPGRRISPTGAAGLQVYRFDRGDELSIATDAIVHPNGLAFSPDE